MLIVFKNSVLAGNPLGLGFHADVPLTYCTLRRIPYGLGCPRLCARHYKQPKRSCVHAAIEAELFWLRGGINTILSS